MPTTPTPSGKEPAEGSRDTVDFELARQKGAAGSGAARPAHQPLAPGDDAAPGSPGTGEDFCPACHGTGTVQNKPCANCEGTGVVVKAIGGA
jgi:hypothetical protein